jgi:hypothetical protein
MKRVWLLVLFTTSPLGAQNIETPLALHAKPGSTLTIRGSTTIGANWHCRATNVVATAIMNDSTVSADAHEVRWVSVIVPISALRCQSGPMERAMRKAMRAESDPTQRIEGQFATDPGRPPESRAAHLAGTLTVTGVTQNVVLSADVERRPEGMLRVRSSVPLTLSAFRITPPRVLFGAIRARDAISVEVDLVF